MGKGKGAIVTDNLLTIGAAKLFDNPKTVFHLVHDYYYVNQNVQAGDLVDVAIAHSSFFSDAVFASNPGLFAGRSFYIPYGVQQVGAFPSKDHPGLNLVFLGRLDEAKGVMQLHEINKRLLSANVQVNWTIIGKGPLKGALVKQWEADDNILFHEPATTMDVYALLSRQDVFVFPTAFEGTPVSILECLANGVVTVTNDLPGGIRDIVQPDIGYRCAFNDLEQFADCIAMQYHNRAAFPWQMQQNCFELSKKHFDIEKNADNYFEKFMQYDKFKRAKKHGVLKMSRLDKAIFPNALVKRVRSF